MDAVTFVQLLLASGG